MVTAQVWQRVATVTAQSHSLPDEVLGCYDGSPTVPQR